MNNDNAPARPELKTITKNGTYVLKLCKPKDEVIWTKFKYDKNGKAYARIFFKDNEGNCLTQFFTAANPKNISITVGKFSSTFVEAPDPKISVEDLVLLFTPAFGKTAKVQVEVKEDKPYNGKPQFKYFFKTIEPVAGFTAGTSIDF